jgi:hypothetical protein
MNKKFFDDIPVFTPVSQAGAPENEPVPPEEDGAAVVLWERLCEVARRSRSMNPLRG